MTFLFERFINKRGKKTKSEIGPKNKTDKTLRKATSTWYSAVSGKNNLGGFWFSWFSVSIFSFVK